MTPSELKTLAGRVEAATGPDRELDAAIAAACRHALPKGGEWARKFPKWEGAPNKSGDVRIIGNVNGNGNYIAGTFRSPAYTASLDAAMTLANGFVLLHLSDIGADGLPLCKLGDPGTTPAGEWTGIASRLELAVCSAALRARANQGAADE